MIIFSFDGRLGNQLFQYAFLSNISKDNEFIILLNASSLFNVANIKLKGITIQNKYAIYIFDKLLVPLFIKPLSKFKLISMVAQHIEKTSDGYNMACDSYSLYHGVLPITFIEKSYYQSEKLMDPAIKNKISIRKDHLEAAAKLLSVISPTYHKIFIHVRRRDYLTEEYYGKKGVCLPASYYTKQIEWFMNNVLNPFFIFLSDDIEFVENNFNNVQPKLFCNNSTEVDFAVMTLCDSAIISNSSFSWWGAYLMKNRYKVFSPRYWLGFKSKIEYPQGIQPAFAEIVDVECELTTQLLKE